MGQPREVVPRGHLFDHPSHPASAPSLPPRCGRHPTPGLRSRGLDAPLRVAGACALRDVDPPAPRGDRRAGRAAALPAVLSSDRRARYQGAPQVGRARMGPRSHERGAAIDARGGGGEDRRTCSRTLWPLGSSATRADGRGRRWSAREIGRGELRANRPLGVSRPSNPRWPEQATLPVALPPSVDPGSAGRFLAEVGAELGDTGGGGASGVHAARVPIPGCSSERATCRPTIEPRASRRCVIAIPRLRSAVTKVARGKPLQRRWGRFAGRTAAAIGRWRAGHATRYSRRGRGG